MVYLKKKQEKKKEYSFVLFFHTTTLKVYHERKCVCVCVYDTALQQGITSVILKKIQMHSDR